MKFFDSFINICSILFIVKSRLNQTQLKVKKLPPAIYFHIVQNRNINE